MEKVNLEYLSKCNVCGGTSLHSVDEKNNIVQCGDCGYVFDNPRPTEEAIEHFYSKPAKYDFWLEEEHARYLTWERRYRIVKKYKAKGALFDIGAGTGQFLSLAKKDFVVAGTEISDSGIQIAKERYKLDIQKGKIEQLDFQREQFDVVTMFHVLEHVSNPSAVIQKCRGLLKKNGVLIIAVPNDLFSFEAMAKRILARLPWEKYKKYGRLGLKKITLDGNQDEIHVSHFTTAVLSKLLTNNGLVILEDALDPHYPLKRWRRYIDGVLYVICSMIKRLFNKNIYYTICMVAAKQN